MNKLFTYTFDIIKYNLKAKPIFESDPSSSRHKKNESINIIYWHNFPPCWAFLFDYIIFVVNIVAALATSLRKFMWINRP